MKIYSKWLFLRRLFVSLFFIALVVIPFVYGHSLGKLISEHDGQNPGPIVDFLFGAFIVVVIEGLFYLALFGIYNLITWITETKLLKKWIYWLTTQDVADKFIENV